METQTAGKNTKDSVAGNYVMGIGASAGGLEALLAKHTEMKVFEAEEDMPIKPDCIYSPGAKRK